MKRKKRPFLKIQRQRFQLHFNNQSSEHNIPSERRFYQWLWHAFKNEYRRAELSLVLLDEADARVLNRDYRQKDYATNVLSFALNEGEFSFAEQDGVLRGDLVICPQVVVREAAEQGKLPAHHYAHLAIHGTLHLMGYDHIADDEAEELESLDTRLLTQLGIPNPYA